VNRLLRAIAFALLSVTLCCPTTAMVRTQKAFDVKRSWYDQDNLYVLIEETEYRVHVGVNDIHGTVKDEKRTQRIAVINRATIRSGMVVDARSAVLQTTPLLFRDELYEIVGGRLIARQSGRVLFACNDPNYFDTAPFRLGERISFCGSLIDSSGVSDRLKTAEADLSEPRSGEAVRRLPGANRRFLTASDGSTIWVVPHESFGQARDLSLASFSAHDGSFTGMKSVSVPSASGDFRLEYSGHAYSPGWLMMRSAASEKPQRIALCRGDACRVLLVPGYPSYVIVDAERRTIFTLEQKTVADPNFTLQVLGFVP